jgi:hypothetical protein
MIVLLSCKRPWTVFKGVMNAMLIGGIFERRLLVLVGRDDT